ncbi:MAG: efflux RND transporter periplasmic adaptor subunit [Candidatus Rokuibacteriota bacterium]|nr:MAG: efflux RND transporter periplasmic adaptor subunit [Candidatus Rokubacteria bacterium]
MWTAVRLVVVAAWMAGILAGCSEKTPPAPTAVPVVVATAVTKPMPVRVQAVGNILAAESVTVRSQVTGQLSAVHFTEGQDVKRGQLLFTIDPRPFETQLQQAQAELTRVLAAAEFARREAARYQELFNRGLVARSQYEQVASNAASAEAMARAARAAVDNTRLQLSYTAVRAPLDGRSGRVLVDRGNLVQANATDLLVINQLRPIEASFAVPSDYLNEIRRRAEQNELEVTATPAGDSTPAAGRLTFVDNRVDPQTGTIQLKATFANEDARLWPGQFVTVVVTLGIEPNALVVPSAAVQAGQQGTYVFVVKPDGTADLRPVAVARQVADETVLAKGLNPGETVVTDGQLRLAPGLRVEVQSQPQPSASPAMPSPATPAGKP